MAMTKSQVLAYLEPDEPDYASAAELGYEVLPILNELLDDPRPGIAAKAASLAGMVGGDDAVAVLQKAGDSADPVVRVAAAGASSGLSASQAAIVLTPLVADQDVGVQKTALNATPATLPSDLREAIEQIDPATSDAAIVELSQRTLGVETDVGAAEPLDASATDMGVQGDTGEMPVGEMPTGEMPTGEMGMAGDETASGDMAMDDRPGISDGGMTEEMP